MRHAFTRAAISFLCAAALGLPGAASAHGSVSMEKDVCKLAAGPYVMHFTGYQPERTRAEFCEDIPNKGHTVIVLDLLDDAVRDMPLQVKFVRADAGPPATAPAIFSSTARTYPTGSVAVDYTFENEGDFVGVVTLGSPSIYVAEFPFSVGKSRMWMHFLIGAAALAAAAGLLFLVAHRRLRQAVIRSSQTKERHV